MFSFLSIFFFIKSSSSLSLYSCLKLHFSLFGHSNPLFIYKHNDFSGLKLFIFLIYSFLFLFISFINVPFFINFISSISIFLFDLWYDIFPFILTISPIINSFIIFESWVTHSVIEEKLLFIIDIIANFLPNILLNIIWPSNSSSFPSSSLFISKISLLLLLISFSSSLFIIEFSIFSKFFISLFTLLSGIDSI